MTAQPVSNVPDLAALRRDFPILHAQSGARAAAFLSPDLSRQCRDHAMSETGRGGDGGGVLRTLRQRAPGSVLASRAHDRAVRGRAGQGATLPACPRPGADHLYLGLHAGDQSRRPQLGRCLPEARRRNPPHGNGTPREPGAVATGGAKEPSGAAVCAADRRRPTRPGRPGAAPQPPHQVVAVTAVSNVLGTVNPIGAIIAQAHGAGAVVLVDAAQHVPHRPTDVAAWDVDFLACSGHKMLGPSGVGILDGGASCSRPCHRSWAAAT